MLRWLVRRPGPAVAARCAADSALGFLDVSEEAPSLKPRSDQTRNDHRLDPWFEDYRRQVAERKILDPFPRASFMQATWRRYPGADQD